MSQALLRKKSTRLVGEQNLIRRVLVALDGSQPANKALGFALDLAGKYSADVVLISVIPPFVAPMASYLTAGPTPVHLVAMDTYSRRLRKDYQRLLSEALKDAKKLKPGLKVSTMLEEGRPSDKIIETARTGNFDIIVMGSRGLGSIKEFFLGSVSDRVADEAPCPVLIVR